MPRTLLLLKLWTPTKLLLMLWIGMHEEHALRNFSMDLDLTLHAAYTNTTQPIPNINVRTPLCTNFTTVTLTTHTLTIFLAFALPTLSIMNMLSHTYVFKLCTYCGYGVCIIIVIYRSSPNNPILISDIDEPVVRNDAVVVLDDEVADSANTGYNGMRYVFTLNNPGAHPLLGAVSTYDNADFGDVLSSRFPPLKYVIWALEKGASGTPHYQGYLELVKKSKSAALIKNKARPLGMWISPAKGTAAESFAYISHTGKHIGKAGLLGGPWEKGKHHTVKHSVTNHDSN